MLVLGSLALCLTNSAKGKTSSFLELFSTGSRAQSDPSRQGRLGDFKDRTMMA